MRQVKVSNVFVVPWACENNRNMDQILLVPGLFDSGPQHWQTLWHQQHPEWQRIQHDDWTEPDLDRWVGAVNQLLASSTQPLTLVAHSFGCLASLYASQTYPEKVKSLFLVAPADPELVGLPASLMQFQSKVPGRIIASSNDHWMALDRVMYWAAQWRFPVSVLGPLGHINSDSGFGDWPEGYDLLKSHLTKNR